MGDYYKCNQIYCKHLPPIKVTVESNFQTQSLLILISVMKTTRTQTSSGLGGSLVWSSAVVGWFKLRIRSVPVTQVAGGPWRVWEEKWRRFPGTRRNSHATCSYLNTIKLMKFVFFRRRQGSFYFVFKVLVPLRWTNKLSEGASRQSSYLMRMTAHWYHNY